MNFLEDKPNVAGIGPNLMFDIDTLTMSMNYQPIFTGNQTNGNAGTKENINAGQAEMNTVPGPQYVLLPFLTSVSQSLKNSEDEVTDDAGKKNGFQDLAKEDDINGLGEATNTNNTNILNTVSSPVNTDANSTYRMLTPVSAAESSYENLGGSTLVNAAIPSNANYPTDPLMPNLEDTVDLQDTGIFGNAYDDAEADLNNLETTMNVYVDDIIFGSTIKSLCTEFESLMHKRFQMSSIRELTFFLGLQVKQKDDGIFISQDKYVTDILKKFDFSSVKTASTPLETNKALIKDEEAEDVDVHLYRSMIGSLMYLTASRLDIMLAVCAYARDSPFELEAFSDSDYAGASLNRKSIIGGCQFLGKRLISRQYRVKTAKVKHIECLVLSGSSLKSWDTKIPQSGGPPTKVGDEAVYKELGDRMERAATTASSLEAEQDSGRARDQRNKFESVFRQDKDANCTYKMFTPVSAVKSSYENLGGSTPVNTATPSNADYPTDPLMPDLEDTADLQDTSIFGNTYDDEDVGAEDDLNNLETTMSVSPIPTTRIYKDHLKEQILEDKISLLK
ncbi:uncharacterized mitochondrial protein-like protein [Tanacetum coccineum]